MRDVGILDLSPISLFWTRPWNTGPDGVAHKIGIAEDNSSRFSHPMEIEWTWLRDLQRQHQEDEKGKELRHAAGEF